MRRAVEGKLKVNGHLISESRYADDTVLISEDEQNLQEMISSLRNECIRRGLNIDKRKPKVMVFDKSKENPTCSIYTDSEKIEKVEEFEYPW